MDDPRAAEGVEHLQGAARELLKAARSFLDVIEEVVEDPERLTGAAAGLADVVRSGLGRREAPWQQAAWEPTDHSKDDVDVDLSDADGTGDPGDEVAVDAAVAEPAEPTPPRTPGPTRSGSSRVRRIAVD
jgi:hypothetical protein